MTQITINSLDRRRGAGFLSDAIKAIGEALRHQAHVRQTRRTIMAELDQFSPDEIVELGISRADIAHIAEEWARR